MWTVLVKKHSRATVTELGLAWPVEVDAQGRKGNSLLADRKKKWNMVCLRTEAEGREREEPSLGWETVTVTKLYVLINNGRIDRSQILI